MAEEVAEESAPARRRDNADAFRTALRAVRREVGVPLAFAGDAAQPTLRLSYFNGNRTDGLRGLLVQRGFGLGGRVLDEARPGTVHDYATAGTITHDYDAPVLAEGIYAVTAVPVVVRGTAQGVLYGAIRESVALGDRVTEGLVRVARRLAGELTVRQEVDRRVEQQLAAAREAAEARVSERLREAHAELRSVSAAVDDPDLRQRLQRIALRLQPQDGTPAVVLTARETDVLAQVAVGCTNAETAARLGVKPETVKSHLSSALAKLGAGNRQAAVVAARRAGLLP
ncbi:helix-turn-helix transcriptional regulator [Streptomyces triticagri]|uniref:helix-turn-helix transcriptional regulator n=1 Tax=Streptomyces triticagri TaxID=2293568 RepID=UPI001F2420E6|nr:helix-turn-helix transcriptional regulator [Streptomyces triticagri]